MEVSNSLTLVAVVENQSLQHSFAFSERIKATVSRKVKSVMKAIVAQGKGLFSIIEVHKPVVPENEWVLVKVEAIADNSTDWKHIDYGWTDAGSPVGCDYSGVVEELGMKVSKFIKGSRIGGMVHGW